MSRSPTRLLPLVPVLLAPFILYADILLTGKTLFWGLPTLQFVPWRAYALDLLRAGVLPLWNPLNGMGAPLLANYQLAFFYPPSWILYLFDLIGGSPLQAWANGLLVVLHLCWAGWGMTRLLRILGADALGQAIGGMAFSLCGYFVARSGVFPMIWTGAWLPWVMAGVARGGIPGRRDGTKAPFFDPGLCLSVAMLLLAGHAQLAWYTLSLAGVWALVGGWSRAGARGAVYCLARFGLAGLVAAMVAAAQLLPTAEYLGQSQRSSAVDFDLGLTYSFWPWRLLTFFAPNFFGNPGHGNYWGYAAFWEDAAYFGMLPLLLALGSLSVTIRRRGQPVDCELRGLVLFLWVIMAVSLLLALGKNTPAFPFLYGHVPTFALFQAPTRWLLLGIFAYSMLAGIQASHMTRPVGGSGRWLRRALAAAAAVTLGAGAAGIFLREVDTTLILSTALAGLWALGAGLLVLSTPWPSEPQKRARWSLLVVVFILLDLSLAGWALKPGANPDLMQRGSAAGQAIHAQAGDGRVYLDPGDEYLIKFWRFFRFSSFHPLEDWGNMRATLLPNLNLLDGVPSANNFDPLVPARYARWSEYLQTLSPAQREPYLRIMGVTLIERMNIRTAEGVNYQPLSGARRWYWSECPLFAVQGEDAWDLLIHNTGFLSPGESPAWVVLEDDSSDFVSDCAAVGHEATIDLIAEQPDRVEFEINSSAEGWLVLADTWYPGWNVTVDGRPAELLKANYLFRGVALPKGRHVIVFNYRPRSFMIGVILSGLGLMTLGAAAWYQKRRHPTGISPGFLA